MYKHHAEFIRALDDGDFTETDNGILIKSGGPFASGRYFTTVDGELVTLGTNKIPLEALRYFLQTGLLDGTKSTSFYMALFSAATDPLDSWTAANFASNANEITSSTEGYSNSTRPPWTPSALAAGESKTDNLGDLATYNIVCSTSIDIAVAAVLTSNTKGGTTGILISAGRFDTPHTVNNGSTFELGYEVELQDI